MKNDRENESIGKLSMTNYQRLRKIFDLRKNLEKTGKTEKHILFVVMLTYIKRGFRRGNSPRIRILLVLFFVLITLLKFCFLYVFLVFHFFCKSTILYR